MGGFHGGHHGGGHHGGGFHSHSSFSFSGGSSRHHYYGGGYRENLTIEQKMGVSIIGAIVGILLIIFWFKVPTTATITATNVYKENSVYYEEYSFDYDMYWHTFEGYGEDKLGYDSSYLPTKVGEKYTLYVSPFIPTYYDYDTGFLTYGIMALIFTPIEIFVFIYNLSLYRDKRRRLLLIGDLNGDGVIDEKDLEFKRLQDLTEANKSNNSIENKTNTKLNFCLDCGFSISENETKCPNCGKSFDKYTELVTIRKRQLEQSSSTRNGNTYLRKNYNNNSKLKFCPECGFSVDSNDKKCSNCGAIIFK